MLLNIAKHGFTLIWDGVYYFTLSNYPKISPWELKKLLMFIEYEKQNKRHTDIVCEDKTILSEINNAIAHPETVMNTPLPIKITECTACKQGGCLTQFVCHTAEKENAIKIFSCGKLLSALKASDKPVNELINNKRNGANDPEDYFEYIMFSWGNCIAGDSLVTERSFVKKHDRLPSQTELDEENEKKLITGVRFYFRYKDIIKHPGYTFDGYHPAKVKDELLLSDFLLACIVPKQYKHEIEKFIQPELLSRVYYIPQDGLGILDWSERVYNFVEKTERLQMNLIVDTSEIRLLTAEHLFEYADVIRNSFATVARDFGWTREMPPVMSVSEPMTNWQANKKVVIIHMDCL